MVSMPNRCSVVSLTKLAERGVSSSDFSRPKTVVLGCFSRRQGAEGHDGGQQEGADRHRESSGSAEGAAVELANGMLRNVRQNVM
jgi:hypothetical protein